MPPKSRMTWVTTKKAKIGARTETDSFTPRRLRTTSTTMAATSSGSFQPRNATGSEAEDGVAAAGDGDRDGEDVVDQQRRPGDHADRRAEQLGGHHVAAAAEGEALDDLGVGDRDDEDGDRGGEPQRHRQVGVPAERAEGLVRAVGRGGEPVGAQPDPGQHGDERDAVVGAGVLDVARRAEDQVAQRGAPLGVLARGLPTRRLLAGGRRSGGGCAALLLRSPWAIAHRIHPRRASCPCEVVKASSRAWAVRRRWRRTG